MPVYLDTRGNTKIAIAVCARCGVKYPWTELTSDPNYPGLKVCPDGCKDDFDPWRLPSRATEDITLEWSRPDANLNIGPQNVPVLPIEAVYPLVGNLVIGPNGQPVIGPNGLPLINPLGPAASGAGLTVVAGPPGAGYFPAAPPVSIINQPAQPWAPQQAYALGAQVTQALPVQSAAARFVNAVIGPSGLPVIGPTGNPVIGPLGPAPQQPSGIYGSTVSGTNPEKVFLCVVPGESGYTAPNWPTTNGVLVDDGTVVWLCNGFFLP